MSRFLLLLALFLLTFGPKVAGRIDVVAITSLLLGGIHFLFFNTQHIPQRMKVMVGIVAAVFSLLLGYATVQYLTQLDGNPYQIMRFGRILVNLLGIVCLVSLYYRMFAAQAARRLCRDVLHCLVIHAVVMLVMFCSGSARTFVIDYLVQVDPDSRTYETKRAGHRIAGLTGSWDALSGLESLGLLMLPILLTRDERLPLWYTLAAVPLLLFAVAISGRTGFVTLGVLLPIALLFTDWQRAHRGFCAVLALGMFLMLAGYIVLQPAFANRLAETSLMRSAAVFGIDSLTTAQSHDTMRETFHGICQQYFLPDDQITFLFGTGGSGRERNDYVPADNGLILNLHNLGIFAFLLLYGPLLYMLASTWALRPVDTAVAGCAFLAVALICMIDAKVAYAYSRNGFTAMMVLVTVAWWQACQLPACRSGAPGRGWHPMDAPRVPQLATVPLRLPQTLPRAAARQARAGAWTAPSGEEVQRWK